MAAGPRASPVRRGRGIRAAAGANRTGSADRSRACRRRCAKPVTLSGCPGGQGGDVDAARGVDEDADEAGTVRHVELARRRAGSGSIGPVIDADDEDEQALVGGTDVAGALPMGSSPGSPGPAPSHRCRRRDYDGEQPGALGEHAGDLDPLLQLDVEVVRHADVDSARGVLDREAFVAAARARRCRRAR